MTLAESILPKIQRYIPADEWGDAWEVAIGCESRYNPAKGASFYTFFYRRWKGWKLDQARARHGRPSACKAAHIVARKRMSNMAQVHSNMPAPDSAEDHGERAERTLRAMHNYHDLYDFGRMLASGMNHRHIAEACGVAMATTFNWKRAARSTIKSPAFTSTEAIA